VNRQQRAALGLRLATAGLKLEATLREPKKKIHLTIPEEPIVSRTVTRGLSSKEWEEVAGTYVSGKEDTRCPECNHLEVLHSPPNAPLRKLKCHVLGCKCPCNHIPSQARQDEIDRKNREDRVLNTIAFGEFGEDYTIGDVLGLNLAEADEVLRRRKKPKSTLDPVVLESPYRTSAAPVQESRPVPGRGRSSSIGSLVVEVGVSSVLFLFVILCLGLYALGK
jgi:hypothetical protein